MKVSGQQWRKISRYFLNGRRLGPRIGLRVFLKRKTSWAFRESNSGSSNPSPSRYTNSCPSLYRIKNHKMCPYCVNILFGILHGRQVPIFVYRTNLPIYKTVKLPANSRQDVQGMKVRQNWIFIEFKNLI